MNGLREPHLEQQEQLVGLPQQERAQVDPLLVLLLEPVARQSINQQRGSAKRFFMKESAMTGTRATNTKKFAQRIAENQYSFVSQH